MIEKLEKRSYTLTSILEPAARSEVEIMVRKKLLPFHLSKYFQVGMQKATKKGENPQKAVKRLKLEMQLLGIKRKY